MPTPTLRKISIGQEHQTPHGWSYEITLDFDDDSTTSHDLRLSWVDYEHWSGGDKPPSLVAERLLEATFELRSDYALKRTADASTLRRQVSGLDEAISRRL